MTQVWVVTSFAGQLIGVFTTREKAYEIATKLHEQGQIGDFKVRAVNLNNEFPL